MSEAEKILKLLDLLIAGSISYDYAMQARAKVQRIVAENRDPTDAEWAELFADSDRLSAELAAAAK